MEFPTLADGTMLANLLISLNPPRYVYGRPEELAWLRRELEKRESEGMSAGPNQGRAPDGSIRWV